MTDSGEHFGVGGVSLFMSWRRWAHGALLMTTLAACASRQRPPTAEAGHVVDSSPQAPRVVVNTLPSTEAERPVAEPAAAERAAAESSAESAPPHAQPVAPPLAAAPTESAPEATTADPFNSDSVDKNREGRHIMDRALKMPAPDQDTDGQESAR